MSDFYQKGVISTLHNLTDRSVEDLEQDLITFSQTRPISLVLPSLFSELEGPALQHIVDELSQVPYLAEITIGLDQANKEQFEYAKNYFSKLPQRHRILWNEGPRMQALDQELKDKNISPRELGKGRNVWFCFGYTLSSRRAEVVGLHDCDILTYDRKMLARLLYPVANPNFSYVFAKGFYPRINQGKLSGRVTRLLVTPLLHALKKVCGDNDYITYLDSFRYPLAGEFAMRASVVSDIRIPSDWGLEIGVLSEVRRNYSTKVIAQVDIADQYDHKHQIMSEEDATKGLSRMSIDISKAIFRKLATDGEIFSLEKFRTVKATYYRTALDLIENYHNDAMMNGLVVDRHEEEQAVELFAQNIMEAGQVFLEYPQEVPFIPSWSRVNSAMPGFLSRLNKAVEEDNA
ncbi:Glucosyl-3-phosphoglycerate synthase [Candidatus Terasakiella magnetica]|uniref:Glucosyl-3-phosphoglycerate synthase n=1 Tax=Candidatus Terasakiella magnetica TaxID=1867952 RepID=A0A1C3RKV1_9PROT|nr:glycosyl transferase [Candidatus Terasakiella magnetica]SCA57950.1 Glucosyl-3-phosphoglycerate synthase [Candidatus Terasakiella magnetica]